MLPFRHVARFHAHDDDRLRLSGDTVGAHTDRVYMLAQRLVLHMGGLISPDLSCAIQYHDYAECILGDMPAPAKYRFPALAAAYAKAELQIMNDAGLNWNLTRQEAAILDLCDKLDAWQWATQHCGVSHSEWDAALVSIRVKAAKLGATKWLYGEVK